MLNDLRLGVRALRRSPGFTGLAVLTLALGIGLVTAMCAVLDGTLWHPLPFPEAERLVAVGGIVSRPTVVAWQQATRSFDSLAGYRSRVYTLSGTGAAASLKATVASGSLFTVLRAQPATGRALSAQDDADTARVAVLSDEAWREWFDSDPAVLGRMILLNRVGFRVVGVMPPAFRFPINVGRVDIYTTISGDLQTDAQQAAKGRPRDLLVVGRLKTAVRIAQAGAEISAVGPLDDADGAPATRHAAPIPVVALSEQVSGALAEPLLILAAAVACVLLVACSTVAVLMLIRATTRQAELATRLAVGASRSDILRLFLVEGCLLTVGATMLGAGVAVVTARTLLAAAGSDINSVARATFGLRVFGLATLAAAGTVLFIGAIPALHAASAHWPDLLRGSPKAGRGRGAAPSRVGRILLTAQIAMSVALLAVCLTLVRTYTTLSAVNPGFEADGVITFRVDLPDALYPVPQRAAFFDRVRDETARLPGVQSAAFAALLPFGDIRYTMRLDAPGAAGPADPVAIEVHIVSAGFLHAMHIPLLAGRDFDSTDSAGGPKVAIISRTLARRCFGTADPVGRTLEAAIGPSSAGEGALLIVGVAGDVKNGSLVAPAEPQVYVPYVQAPLLASATFVARVAPSPAPGDLTPLVASVRDRVRTLDRSVAVVAFRPLRDAVQATLGRQRFNMIISGTFAASGTVLTVVALYAAVLYSATRRRKEFAIRLAVGAGSRAIGWLVVREGLSVIVPGVAIGITGAIALTRALGSLIYGVQPDQIAVLCLTAAVSSVVTLIATWHPAFTATRVDLRATLQSL